MIFHLESNKIDFAFFQFSYYFLRNLQDPVNLKYYLSCHFADRPLKFPAVHNYTLTFAV
jgi:hypothetical protein